MAQRFAQPWIQTSVNVTPEMHRLCLDNRVKFSDAMRAGISLLLAEKGVEEYDNKLNVMRRMDKVTSRLSATSQELEALKQRLELNGE